MKFSSQESGQSVEDFLEQEEINEAVYCLHSSSAGTISDFIYKNCFRHTFKKRSTKYCIEECDKSTYNLLRDKKWYSDLKEERDKKIEERINERDEYNRDILESEIEIIEQKIFAYNKSNPILLRAAFIEGRELQDNIMKDKKYKGI